MKQYIFTKKKTNVIWLQFWEAFIKFGTGLFERKSSAYRKNELLMDELESESSDLERES